MGGDLRVREGDLRLWGGPESTEVPESTGGPDSRGGVDVLFVLEIQTIWLTLIWCVF